MKKYFISKYLQSQKEVLNTQTVPANDIHIAFNLPTGEFVIYNSITREVIETGAVLFKKVEFQRVEDNKAMLKSDFHVAVNWLPIKKGYDKLTSFKTVRNVMPQDDHSGKRKIVFELENELKVYLYDKNGSLVTGHLTQIDVYKDPITGKIVKIGRMRQRTGSFYTYQSHKYISAESMQHVKLGVKLTKADEEFLTAE